MPSSAMVAVVLCSLDRVSSGRSGQAGVVLVEGVGSLAIGDVVHSTWNNSNRSLLLYSYSYLPIRSRRSSDVVLIRFGPPLVAVALAEVLRKQRLDCIFHGVYQPTENVSMNST